VIAFSACVGSQDKYRRYAVPGIRAVAEPDSVVAEVTTDTSIFTAYNEVLDALSGRDDLEALVLLHEDTEIVDGEFCAKVRRLFADTAIAVAGPIGASGVDSLRWWEGTGRGRVRETRGLIDLGGPLPADVDVLDGLILVLSPWAARELRFDEERFTGFHGYDADICCQARAAGRRVVAADLRVLHHTKGGYGDQAAFAAADEAWRMKWLGDPATGRAA
jgi:hypothetical protein